MKWNVFHVCQDGKEMNHETDASAICPDDNFQVVNLETFYALLEIVHQIR